MTVDKSRVRDARRLWLKQAGALTGAASLPLLGTSALSFAQSKLNGLPRIALVIGNTRYRDAPLKNPVNDAKAIAGELQQTGFTVNLQLDAGRAQMAGSIRSFGEDLARSKGVGLFYYAGHGAQLAWRNYLIPVDAVIEKLEDLRDKTVDLSALLQGLLKASNPMNVIILDACRDNPFGTRVPTEAKGLSQFDAPPGSLLAYATSPGNTAGDGDGANGLYTEHLLREIRVPDAKIEDVFKRVRLAVRRRSEGRQIPWESTSLEDDFYFVPPKQDRRLSEDELEKQFEEELTIWEKIKASKEPEPLEDYIRRFPRGKFSELAQFRLDRVLAEREKKQLEAEMTARRTEEERRARLAEEKRIAAEKRLAEERKLAEAKRIAEQQQLAKLSEDKRRAEEARLAEERKAAEERRAAEERKIAEERLAAEKRKRAEEDRLAKSEAGTETVAVAPAPVNPFSKGTGRLNVNYRIGDRYRYRVVDTLTKLERRTFTDRVSGVAETEVTYNDGRFVKDLLGNNIRRPNGTEITDQQFYVSEYSLGKKWTTRYEFVTAAGPRNKVEVEFKVVAKETCATKPSISARCCRACSRRATR